MLRIQACFVSLSFAGLVVLARSLNPIPSRTRPLNSSAPMVLWLKPWESRSLPDLPRTKHSSLRVTIKQNAASPRGGGVFVCASRDPRARGACRFPASRASPGFGRRVDEGSVDLGDPIDRHSISLLDRKRVVGRLQFDVGTDTVFAQMRECLEILRVRI